MFEMNAQKLGFENALLTFDAFAAHLTDDVESQLLQAKTDTVAIPPWQFWLYLKVPTHGCFSKLSNCLSVAETFPDASQDLSFKTPTPTRQQMVDWVKEAFDYLTRNQEMVKHSFEVCGITVSDTEKVRNAHFYKRCMKVALESLGNEVEDDNPFPL